MEALAKRGADKPEAIKSPITNLTLGTAGAATIATLVAAFNESFDSIFGKDAGPTIKAAVLIAIITAWTLIAVTDLISRAVAKAATEYANGLERAAKASAPHPAGLVPMPNAVTVTKLSGRDEGGFLAAAVRNGNGDADGEGDEAVLLVKADRAPEWVKRDEVDFGP